jgi:hypothetical protein
MPLENVRLGGSLLRVGISREGYLNKFRLH